MNGLELEAGGSSVSSGDIGNGGGGTNNYNQDTWRSASSIRRSGRESNFADYMDTSSTDYEPMTEESHPSQLQSQSTQPQLPPPVYQPPAPMTMMSSPRTTTNRAPLQQLPPSDHGRQDQRLPQPSSLEERVVVETVESDDDSENGENDDKRGDAEIQNAPAPVRLVLACMPQTEEQALQGGLALLVGLMVLGAVVSLLAVQTYRLVITVVWLWLFALLGFFLYFVREQQRQGQRVLFPRHPVLQAAVDFVSNEVELFRQDWRAHVLMLTYPEDENNGDDADPYLDPSPPTEEGHVANSMTQKKRGWRLGRSKNNTMCTSTTPLNDQDVPTGAEQEEHPPVCRHRQRQPKSRVFKTFAMPLLPLLRRRQQHHHQQQPNNCREQSSSSRGRQSRGRQRRRHDLPD